MLDVGLVFYLFFSSTFVLKGPPPAQHGEAFGDVLAMDQVLTSPFLFIFDRLPNVSCQPIY